MDRLDIVNGIEAELEKAAETIKVKAYKVRGNDPVVVMFEPMSDTALDETLEGASATWSLDDRVRTQHGVAKGAADLLVVAPEKGELALRYCKPTPPVPGTVISIEVPAFLRPVLKAYQDPDWWNKIQGEELRGGLESDSAALKCAHFREARNRQREAFRLSQYGLARLCGPPGTGKTTTLGAMLAELLMSSSERVLLLSTTNGAVDLALTSVDKQLQNNCAELAVRSLCKRIGSHYRAKHYAARQHLLAANNHELVERRVAHEAAEPSHDRVEERARWMARLEELRQEESGQSMHIMNAARIVAMTATRAAFTLPALRELDPFDWIVFDEASQVGLAHALALMPLGKRCLFTGDPQQLGPIARSNNPSAQRWLGHSPFDFPDVEDSAQVMLDEPSRMAEPISRLVSATFYNRKLRVADQVEPGWHKARELPSGPAHVSKHISVLPIKSDGQWDTALKGWTRSESVEALAEAVKDIAASGTLSAFTFVGLGLTRFMNR